MKIFNLPDLGEGLVEAEILEWHVKPGDEVKTGDILLAVETAKAVVEIPSPWDGRIEKLFVPVQEVVAVGSPLVGFAGTADDTKNAPEKRDTGSVVGEINRGDEVLVESAAEIGKPGSGIRAVPAVRALAKKLKVDISLVKPSGPDGTIITKDVERAAEILAGAGTLELLRGPRRAMAHAMTRAHAEVADVTVTDDADISDWREGTDITIRLIRAVIAGCQHEPALNAWYDPHTMGRRLLKTVDLGMAVDTPEGLFVPVLRDVANRDDENLRAGLERIKADVLARSIPPEEMQGYGIILSNYGVIGGRYSDPIVVPPTVAILGAGRIRDQVLAIDGKPEVRRVVPLSLTFDHRVVTGGEATRFLMAVIESLSRES